MDHRTVIEVYCDGGVGKTILDDVLTAHFQDYVGRTAVIIPGLDYGVVETFYDSLLLPNGHENGEYAELMAIRHADYACKKMESKLRGGFVIYSDNFGAIKRSGLLHVQHISKDRFHFADEYLYRMMSRANYLRQSAGKVKKRRPASAIHEEIARLMKAERLEFRLSESPLFQAFKSEVSSSL